MRKADTWDRIQNRAQAGRLCHQPAFTPAAVEQSGPAGKPHEEGGQYIMAKSESSKVKPISIRYTCAPNGDQVGLSHYLMADAKKAK